MKIVQSLWSKPGQPKPASYSERNRAGWAFRKYNYISWALSCLQLKKFYEEVELVTDSEGYNLLINKMGLPYTTVKVMLDDLNEYSPDLYAMGKIYAYSIQDRPFIHVDSDVFIWEEFGEMLENSPLLCQNLERGADFGRWYKSVFQEVVDNFDSYPEVMDRSISKNGGIVAINAGIIGGTDLNFFRDYTREAIAFVNKNIRKIPVIRANLFNTIFEQFLFYALAEDRALPIRCYNQDFSLFWAEISDFVTVPAKTKYIHTIGKLKKSRSVVEAMEDRLEDDHPEYYYRIVNLLRTNEI